MARPSELIEVVAGTLGVAVATVREQARVLRNAGHMTKEKGGRGPGAMSFRDATNLILAVAGTSVVRNSHWPVEQLGPLKSASGSWNLEFAPNQEMTSLSAKHTLADAIEALITSVAKGCLGTGGGVQSRTFEPVWVEVSLFEPTPMASLTMGISEREVDGITMPQQTEVKMYETRFDSATGSTVFDPPLLAHVHFDLRHEHKFSHVTVQNVADLLRA